MPKPILSQEEMARRASAAMNGHIPGQRHQVAGAVYQVAESGAWLRLTPLACELSTNTKNKGVRRRAQQAR